MLEAALALFLAALAGDTAEEKRQPVMVGGRTVAHLTLSGNARREPPAAADPRRLHDFADGAAFGEITTHSPLADYRKATIPKGRYRLVYRLQPPLKEHADSPGYRDFLVLEPRHPVADEHPLLLALVPDVASGMSSMSAVNDARGEGEVLSVTVAGRKVTILLPTLVEE